MLELQDRRNLSINVPKRTEWELAYAELHIALSCISDSKNEFIKAIK